LFEKFLKRHNIHEIKTTAYHTVYSRRTSILVLAIPNVYPCKGMFTTCLYAHYAWMMNLKINKLQGGVFKFKGFVNK